MMLSLGVCSKSNGCTAAPRIVAMLGVVIAVTLGSAMDDGYSLYAAPINIPTPSTMAPPSTIWNTACRNGVSM
jgi:hypothetical protein